MDIDSIRAYMAPKQIQQTHVQQTHVQQTQMSKPPEKVTDSASNSAQAANVDKSAEADLHFLKQSAKEKTNEDEATSKMLHTAIDVANKQLISAGRILQASVHEKTNRIQVKVIDVKTRDVVREIPPEKTLDLFAKMLEMVGILHDEKK